MQRHFLIVTLFLLSLSFTGCAQSKKETKKDLKKETQKEQNMNIKEQGASLKEPKVLIETSMGNILVKLYDETPLHRDNFIKLVREGFYDGLIFHRVINGFMIQGGDPESKNAEPGKSLGTGGPGYTVDAEIVYPKCFHKKGALAAARMGDQINPEKKSSGSQFYIVQGNVYSNEQIDMLEQRQNTKFSNEIREAYTTVGGTPHLDDAYTVFGEVIEGLDVIDKIAAVKTGRQDRPVENVTMKMKIVTE